MTGNNKRQGLVMAALLATTLAMVVLTTVQGATKPEPTAPVAETQFPALDMQKVAAEDRKRANEGLPFRFAIPIDFDQSIARGSGGIASNFGTWENLGDGTIRWRLQIHAEGASSLNFGFSKFFMPPGGELYVYDTVKSMVRGPYTDRDNEVHGELWTPVVFGDTAIIEVTVPAEFLSSLELELTQVSHGYREFWKTGADKSGGCNIDVICPEGNGWRDQIRSVAAYSRGGSIFCTGQMINNTAGDLTPYFLTANHCGMNSSNAPSMVVYWNYENSVCRTRGAGATGPGNGSLSDSQTGAIFRASRGASDFTLLELDDDPNPAFDVFWTGWDRSTSPKMGTTIHHPDGEEKRISFDFDPPTTTSYLGEPVPGDGTHWRITAWDTGTTEPGSSGSGLWNDEMRLIGQLHGGFAACDPFTSPDDNDESDWYGQFAISWDAGAGASERLSNWLDPLGGGPMSIDGTGGGDDDDDDDGFVADAGLTGSFGDPSFNGQGINIEVLVEQVVAKDGKGGAPGIALVYWYSYDPFGFPFFTFGVGEIVGDTIEVDMLFDYDGTGPFFGPGWSSNQFIPSGFADVTIRANDCNNLDFSFNSDDPGNFPPHDMDMQRITSVAGLSCVAASKDAIAVDQGPALAGISNLSLDRVIKVGVGHGLERRRSGTSSARLQPERSRTVGDVRRLQQTNGAIKGVDDISADFLDLRTAEGGGGVEITTPMVGQEVFPHIYWTTITAGKGAVTFDVEVRLDGTPFCTGTFSDVPDDGSFFAHCAPAITLPSGQHTLTFEVDSGNDIAESNESNNIFNRNYTVTGGGGGVDISADSVQLRTETSGGGSVVNSPSNGQTLIPTLNVTTSGTAKGVITFDVEIKLDGDVLCAGLLEDMPLNGSFPVWCEPGWTVTPGSHTLRGEVDALNTISETDEGNNTAQKNYNVGGGGGDFAVGPGMSASFFDDDFNGQGINMEILVDQVIAKDGKGGSPGVVLVYWYSYDSSGLPFFAFGVGQFTGNTMVIDMLFDYDGNGPFFGPGWNAGQFSPTAFATMTIIWSDCNNGVMTFVVVPAFAAQFPAHVMNLQRITAIPGLPCP